MSKVKWETTEVAFILAWADYCLHYDLDYKDTITNKLLEVPRTDGHRRTSVTWPAVYSKLRHLLGEKVSEFLKRGTKSISLSELDGSWIEEMNNLRDTWSFRPLEVNPANTPQGKATTSRSMSAGLEEHTARSQCIGDGQTYRAQTETPVTVSYPKTPNADFQVAINVQNDRAISETPASSYIPSDGHQEIRDLAQVHRPNKRRAGSPPMPSRKSPNRKVDQMPSTYDVHSPTVSLITNAPPSMQPRPPNVGVPTPSANDKILSKVDLLGDVMFWVMGKIFEGEKGKTTEVMDRMKSMKNTFTREPESAFASLAEDLVSADAALKHANDLNRDLAGMHNIFRKPVTIELPSPLELDRDWKQMRRNIGEAVGHGSASTISYSSSVDDLTTLVESLLDGGNKQSIPDGGNKQSIPDGGNKQSIPDLVHSFQGYLQSPHAVQLFMSALLCHLLFNSPEPTCEREHPVQFMRLYELIEQTEGIAVVKHLDLLTTQLLFTSDSFRKEAIPRRVELLSNKFWQALHLVHASAPGIKAVNEPQAWFERLFRLRRSLMTSPYDYRIHFVRPGTVFDPSWMRAECKEGFAVADPVCRSKKVKLCLFPALLERPAAAVAPNADIQDVLVKNKRFLPSSQERKDLDPNNMRSKAVVLVE